jgi:membrane-associated protein
MRKWRKWVSSHFLHFLISPFPFPAVYFPGRTGTLTVGEADNRGEDSKWGRQGSVMEIFSELFNRLRDLEGLIQWGGFAILAAIVFAETGLLIGFFLPGDSLLFTAGALVGLGKLHAPAPLPSDDVTGIIALNLLLMAAAIVGDTVGYWFGRKTGPHLFDRPDSRFFKRDHLLKTQAFYEKHGGKTIIMARWIPFARTFAPIVAGVAQMPYTTFMMFNVVGGITWVFSMTMLGFLFCRNEVVKHHNEKVIIGIILLSLLPAVIHWWKERRHASAEPSNAGMKEPGRLSAEPEA